MFTFKRKLRTMRYILELFANGQIGPEEFVEDMALGYMIFFGLAEVEAVKQAEDDMRRFNAVK